MRLLKYLLQKKRKYRRNPNAWTKFMCKLKRKEWELYFGGFFFNVGLDWKFYKWAWIVATHKPMWTNFNVWA